MSSAHERQVLTENLSSSWDGNKFFYRRRWSFSRMSLMRFSFAAVPIRPGISPARDKVPRSRERFHRTIRTTTIAAICPRYNADGNKSLRKEVWQRSLNIKGLKASFERCHFVRAIFILCAVDIVTRLLSTRRHIATRVDGQSVFCRYVCSTFSSALIKYLTIRL